MVLSTKGAIGLWVYFYYCKTTVNHQWARIENMLQTDTVLKGLYVEMDYYYWSNSGSVALSSHSQVQRSEVRLGHTVFLDTSHTFPMFECEVKCVVWLFFFDLRSCDYIHSSQSNVRSLKKCSILCYSNKNLMYPWGLRWNLQFRPLHVSKIHDSLV